LRNHPLEGFKIRVDRNVIHRFFSLTDPFLRQITLLVKICHSFCLVDTTRLEANALAHRFDPETEPFMEITKLGDRVVIHDTARLEDGTFDIDVGTVESKDD